MAITYNSLVSLVLDYAEEESSEFTDRIQIMVELAEDRLYRDLDTQGFLFHATTSVSSGDPLITKPTGSAIVKSLSWVSSNQQKLLEMKTDEFVQMYWPQRNSVGSSPPKYWANWDATTIILCPTVGNGTLEMSYIAKPGALTSSNTTNWFTSNAERALVAGTMVEAALFMKSKDAVEYWNTVYMEEVQKLLNESRRSRVDDQAPNTNATGENNLQAGP